MKHDAQHGFKFGAVLVFLSLIGFSATAVQLLGHVLGVTVRIPAIGAIPALALGYLTLLYAIMGVWLGATSRRSLGAAALSGLITGLMLGTFVFCIDAAAVAGLDLRKYLVAMSRSHIRFLSYNQAPLTVLALYPTLFVGFSVAGRALNNERTQAVLAALWQKLRSLLTENPPVRAIRQHPQQQLIVYCIITAAILLIPTQLSSFWNYNLGTIGIYVLLGLGLNIVVGMAGLLDLGYVAFFAIGAYTVALLTAPLPHALEWGFWSALPVGILFAGIAGIILGIPVLRLRGDYLAIVTLGFGEIIRVLSKSDLLTGFSGGPRGVRDVAGPTLFGYPFDGEIQFFYLIALCCLLVVFVTARLQHSRVGRAWVAMREDEPVARAMGINTWQYKLMAFAMGAAFAGLGGVLFASRNQFTGPEDHNLLVSINVLALVIVGGMGSIPGVIVGALALKGLPEILRELDAYRLLAFGGLLVAMMIYRPEGLWPSARRRAELHHDEEPAVEGGDSS